MWIRLHVPVQVAWFVMLVFIAGIGNMHAQNPDWEWATSIHTNGFEIIHDVAADPVTNDVYIVGAWKDDLSAIFPTGSVPSTDFNSSYGTEDGFVAKFDEDGNFIWAFKAGGDHDDAIMAIALDDGGNIYVAGTFGKDINYFSGTSPITGSSILFNADRTDFFIAKYNPDGHFIWVRRSQNNADDVTGMALDVNSNAVFAAGTYKSATSFGPLSATALFGNLDVFLIKYDLNGNEQGLVSAGSDHEDYITGISADETHVYISGHFHGDQMEFTNTSGTTVNTLLNVNPGKEDIFLASFTINGFFIWSQRIASNDEDESYGITGDNDSLYLTGAIHDGANFPAFPGNPVSSTANRDIFISSHAKSNGNTGWAYSIPCTDGGDEYGRAIDIDYKRDLFITGYFKKDITFPGPVTLSSIGAEEAFVSAYSHKGTFKWAKRIGSDGKDFGYGIATGSKGTIYAVGNHENGMSLDLQNLPDDGNENGYLGKLQEPCVNATGGTISSSQNMICAGETVLISLVGQTGDISWESSPAGLDLWVQLPGETVDSVIVMPVIDTDYRAFLRFGACNPDSSNVIPIDVDEVPEANPGPGGETCGNTFLLQAVPSVGSGLWTKFSGPGIAAFAPSANNPIATVSVSLFGTYAFTWTETNGICSDDSTVNVTFTAPPESNAGPDDEICILDGSYTLSGTTSANGTILWTSSGDGTFNNATLDNPIYTLGSETGSVTLTKTVSSPGSCADSIDFMVLTLTPQPESDAGPDDEICIGDGSYTLTGTTSANGSILWTTSGDGTFNNATLDNPIYTPGSETGSVTLTKTVSSPGSCADSIDFMVLTLTPQPESDAGPDDEICILDGSYTLSGTTSANGTILWTSSGDGTFNNATIDNPIYTPGSETGSVTLTKTVSSPGSCADSIDFMVLALTPQPESDAGPDDEICIGDGSYTLTGTTSANGSILWTTSGDGTFNNATLDNPIYTPGSETGSVTLTKTVSSPGSCADSIDFMVLSLTPLPESNAGPDDEICILDGTYTLSGTTSANGTILWTSSGDGTFNNATLDNPIYTPGSETGSVTLTKTVSSPGSCADSIDFMVLALTPQPESDAGPDDEICIGDGSYTLTGTTSANGSILWTTSGDGTFNNATLDNPIYTPGSETGSVTLTKTVSSPGSCADSIDFMVLSLTPLPESNAGPDDEICILDGTYTLSGTTSANGTLLWTSSGDGTFNNATLDNPIYTLGSETGSVTLTKTVSSPGSCADLVDTMVLSIATQAVSDAGPDDEVCISDGTYLFTGTTSEDGAVLWSSGGDGSFDDATQDNPTYSIGTETGSVTLTKTVTGPGVCGDSTDNMVLTLTPQPESDAGPDDEICILDGSYSLSGTTAANGTILWTTSGDGTFNNATLNNPLYTFGSETGSVTLTKTVSSPGSCADSIDIMVLTLTPLPESNAGPDDEICILDGTYSLSGTTSANGTILWTSSGDGTFNNATIDNPIYTPGSETGSVTLTKTVSSPGSCADSIDFMVLALTPQPESNAGSDAEICISDGSYSIAGTTSANGTVLWTSSGDGTFDDATIDNPSYAIGTETGSVTLTKTVSGTGSCTDAVDAMNLTLTPMPLSVAGPNINVCLGDGTITLTGATSANGSVVWSSSGNGSFDNVTSDSPIYTFGSETGTITLTKTVVSSGSCPDVVSTRLITIIPEPVSEAGAGGVTCKLEFQLRAIPSIGLGHWDLISGPGLATYSPSETIPAALVTVNQFGRYTFQWTETSGICSDRDTVSIVFIEDFTTNAGTDGEVCGPETRLKATPPRGSGKWTTLSGPGTALFESSDTLHNATVSVDEFGTYEFQWNESLADCRTSDVVMVTFYQEPVANAGPDQVLEFIFSTAMEATLPSYGTGRWQAESGSGIVEDEFDPVSRVNDLSIGNNEFSWIVSSGVCAEASDRMVITVNDLYAPTVITPNNDGDNDFLVFPGIEMQPDTRLLIFNRWGGEVFRTTNYTNNWDGRDNKGRDLIPDTYYYILELPSSRIIKSYVEIRR